MFRGFDRQSFRQQSFRVETLSIIPTTGSIVDNESIGQGREWLMPPIVEEATNAPRTYVSALHLAFLQRSNAFQGS
jgi:hypothetical protein